MVAKQFLTACKRLDVLRLLLENILEKGRCHELDFRVSAKIPFVFYSGPNLCSFDVVVSVDKSKCVSEVRKQRDFGSVCGQPWVYIGTVWIRHMRAKKMYAQ